MIRRKISVVILLVSMATTAEGGVLKEEFARAGGQAVEAFTLTNPHGLEAKVMTYGATVLSLKVPDRSGKLGNVVLGFDTLAPYLAGVPFYGATVGRYANRIGGAQFTLDGSVHRLAANNGKNSLHGGAQGFDKRVWTAEIVDGQSVRMTYVSPDGEEGYPGQLTVHVTYRLDDRDTLAIEFDAQTTAPTVVNLANHAYFNLTGDPAKPILGHLLEMPASAFTAVDSALIPTGEVRPVAGTPFDFRKPHAIGERIGEADQQLRYGGGYDHNWVLDKPGAGALSLAAILTDPESGRRMEVRTTQPGVQFYSGNFLDGKPLPGGTVFAHRTGLCLETQHFPDSPNHPDFPGTVLRPGQTYAETTLLTFQATP